MRCNLQLSIKILIADLHNYAIMIITRENITLCTLCFLSASFVVKETTKGAEILHKGTTEITHIS